MVSRLGTAHLKHFLDKFNLNDKKILNIGCGKDYYDFLPNAINVDEMDWSKYNVPNFMQVNAEKLPFNEEFDAVLIIDVLEHAKHPDKIIKEAYRALKKGGYLFTINTFYFQTHGKEIEGLNYNDYWRFTAEGIELLCTENQFKIITNSYEGVRSEVKLIAGQDNLGLVSIPLHIKTNTIAQK